MKSSVILCGHDPMLLSTRRLILEQAGLSVRTARHVTELDDADGEVLVLCYTLSQTEKVDAVERYRSVLPGARILILGSAIHNLACDGCEILTDNFSPQVFIRRVKQLLSGPRPF